MLINKILYILVAVIFIVFVYSKVKRKLLSEKESIFWMLGAIAVLILSVFPNILDVLAKRLNIYYPPSLLFFGGIIFTLALVFRITTYVSVTQEQVKELAERYAVLEKRIIEVEEVVSKKNEERKAG